MTRFECDGCVQLTLAWTVHAHISELWRRLPYAGFRAGLDVATLHPDPWHATPTTLATTKGPGAYVLNQKTIIAKGDQV